MNKKFELTPITIEWEGKKLFRIKALKSFSDVKVGDLGGFIESEDNLSQNGNSWIHDDAKVFENAKVYDDAEVFGNARVFGNAKVFENAKVYDDAEVFGNAKVCDNANIKECGWVSDCSIVLDNVCVYGNSWVYCNAEIHDNTDICGNAEVYGDTKVYGDAEVCGNAEICNDARVCDDADYVCVRGLGSAYQNTTFFKCKNGDVGVVCGYFNGNLEEFAKKVKSIYGDSKYAKEYLAMVEVVKIHFETME